MTKIGLIRCEKNEDRCPLTGCLTSLKGGVQGFAGYDAAEIAGIFTCRCPGDGLVEKAKILKSKGAEAIHFCTCSFAHKESNEWVMGEGFCDHLDGLMAQVANQAEIPCVKGSAHLPKAYQPETVAPG
ncbi:hypothetical protein DSCO28_04290 [Desulfosarcina ovata subsp. sediminis]|uniref:CGGC domain-containing protein n=1 Tax=Desulfosarcina ovata subsp. sediminis TaxID=885957 RepID=A0A5K7ZQR6_9BACT|nr:CGGC domain-containing protein [Desulfosarcina ovata]BBO79863.1 hypothetical protein DSCO28_04290 [Desulfosarcina ovata subsp. sediminis]